MMVAKGEKKKNVCKRYGVAYLGSKNKLAPDLVEHLPSAPVFYDVFAGGCAVTHAAMLSGRYGRFVVNDFDGCGVRLFCDGVCGKFRDEKRWISRADFARLKDTDPYVKICWSFSNKGEDYLYSKEVEPWKKALHYARVFGDFSLFEEMGVNLPNAERMTIKAHTDEIKEKYIRWYLNKFLNVRVKTEIKELTKRTKEEAKAQKEELRLWLCAALKASGLTQAEVQKRLGTQMAGHYFGRSQWGFPTREYYDKMRAFMPLLDKEYDDVIGLQRLWDSLERLERLERLQSLQRLQRLERLEIHTEDYRSLNIDTPEGLIYCDPPYKGTDGYTEAIKRSGFSHDEFYTWCEKQAALVVISEYNMPSDRFTCVWERVHVMMANQKGCSKVIERLFVVKGREEEYRRRIWQSKAQPSLFDYSEDGNEARDEA